MTRTVAALAVTTSIALATAAFAGELDGKKVLYIDSYHPEYAWSSGISGAVEQSFEGTGVELKMHFMDTKRNKDEDSKVAAAQQAKELIESFQPDVVIACDDNASKYLIVPSFVGSDLPFVFCGVNGTAEPYGFPASNVTGMVEVEAVNGLAELLSSIAGGQRAGFIGSNTLSSERKGEIYEKDLGASVESRHVATFEEYKKAFLELQELVDYVIVDTPSGIEGWDEAEAEAFFLANTRKPTGAFQVDIMPYVAIGFMKMAEEQGEWASDAAKRILSGTPVSDIAVAQNERGQVVVNSKIVEAAGLEVPYSVIEVADKVM